MATFPTTEAALDRATISADTEWRREFGQSLGHITRHSAVFFAGTLFTMAAGYFVKIYVVRILGAELLGIYALGMTLVSFMQVLGLLGLPGAAARFVSVYSATGNYAQLKGFLLKSSGIVVVLSCVMGGVTLFRGNWIAQHVYRNADLGRYMGLFAGLMIFNALTGFYAQVLGGFKDVAGRTVIMNFLGTPLVLVLTVTFLAAGMRLRGYLAAQLIASGLVLGFLLQAAWKLVPPAARHVTGRLPRLGGEVVSFSAASFAMNGIDFVTSQGDKVLIGLYLAAKPVGIYVLASTLGAFVPLILQSVNQIFAPVIADLHARDRRDVLQKLFQTLTRWILAATLPMATVVILFAPQAMRLFGAEFETGWPVLVIVALGQIGNCAVGSVGYLLLMSGHQKRLIKVQVVAAIASVIINVALIPVLGITGAALAAALVNVGSNLWNLVEVHRALHISPYNRSYYKLLIPAGLMTAALAVLRLGIPFPGKTWMLLLLAFLLSYAVFGASLVAFGLDEDDKTVTTNLLGHIRTGLQRHGVLA
jgi:O-antigen/teichoic acid export membrane protein